MKKQEQIAKNLREVFFGESWAEVNLKSSLQAVTWQDATKKIGSLNTISALVYHISYYVTAISKVLEDGPLDAHDSNSFDCPEILSEADWNQLLEKVFTDAEMLAVLIENLPEDKLLDDFQEKKHGDYFRNLNGMIEHTYYHLGQIVLIKKMLSNME